MKHRERVLILGADAGEAAAMARILELGGYASRWAQGVGDARAALGEARIDLVLADLEAPGIAGGELLRDLRARRPGLPVVVVAPAGSLAGALASIRSGAADLLAKPVREPELLHRVAHVLAERALRNENEALKRRLAEREPGGATPAAGAPTEADPLPSGNGRGDGSRLVSRLLNSEIPFDEFEKEILVRALRRTRGNQTRAARLLGMTRRTLQYRIEKFDIDCAELK